MTKQPHLPEEAKEKLTEKEKKYFNHLISEHSKSFVEGLLKMTDEDLVTAVRLFMEFEEDLEKKVG